MTDACDITLEPADNQRLANLCGPFDQHLRQLERRLRVAINSRGSEFHVTGDPKPVRAAGEILKRLYAATLDESLTPARVHLYLQEAGVEELLEERDPEEAVVRIRRGYIRGRGKNQFR